MTEKICKFCGAVYKNQNKHYCSRECAGKAKQGYKTCPVCGKVFKDSACNPTVCCSLECSRKHRSDLHAQGIYDESIEKMRSGFRDFVDRTDPEDRWTAKGWVICSPSGEIIECRNLLNFIREHPDMFDGTPRQAFDGFMKIKATRQGKRPKCPSRSWKGWTLISWSE